MLTDPTNAPDPIISTIPDPQTVRQRLSHCLREAALLRQMLRLAERAAKEKVRKQEGEEHAGD